MVSYIWFFLIIIGIVYSFLQRRMVGSLSYGQEVERSSSMNCKEELMAYIQSLSAEQAKEALAIASAWLLATPPASRPRRR